MRIGRFQKTGHRKNATVWLLAVAFLFCRGGVPFLSSSAAEGDAGAALLEGLLACDAVVDLSAYALPTGELGALFSELVYGYPELFHVALRLSFSTREAAGGRVVAEVYPTYTMTGQELAAARALYRDTVSALLGEMEAAFGGRTRGEAETVLYLHDCLADRYAYDTRPTGNATAYALFRDGVGICQAYALAFLALARGAGLEADLVTSDGMDHAWNHVRVDGVWYHVDVTRDDPIPSAEGGEEVNHARLLRSDEGMASLGYFGYTCGAGHACTDTRFEPGGEAALSAFRGALIPLDGGWAGLDGGAPAAVEIRAEGMTVGAPGDLNRDGAVNPADLLAVYDPLYPEAWRGWLRGRLVGQGS